jgi:hypothetical protein
MRCAGVIALGYFNRVALFRLERLAKSFGPASVF